MARMLFSAGNQATDSSLEELPPEIQNQIRQDLDSRDDTDVEIWPENSTAVDVFIRAQTQWRVSFGGPVGLDYLAVRLTYRSLEYPSKDWADTFWRLQELEFEALRVMSERSS